MELMTLPEAAKQSKESESVWRKRVFTRQIPVVKCGRNVRILKSDFEAWLQQRLIPAANEAGR